MLDSGDKNVGFAKALEGVFHAAKNQTVGLAAARGKNDLVRFGMEKFCRLAAGRLHRTVGTAAKSIKTARVAVLVGEIP